MTEFNIILFLCNWAPHAAYQTLQERPGRIPPEIKMVRIPCTGRISKALLFKAFEMGADGVALIGCGAGVCRYGMGTEAAENNVKDTRGILALLGLGEDRLRLVSFLPEEAEALQRFLSDFLRDIRACGKTPVVPTRKEILPISDAKMRKQILTAYDVYACQDCGKCASACPLTLVEKPFSPRGVASALISGKLDDAAMVRDVWSCLTCGLCYDRCPSAVNFPEFIKDMRRFLRAGGMDGHASHGGFFHSLMRTMTSPDLRIAHWEWLPQDIRTDPESKTLFFGGCAPYFDVFFRKHLGVETRNILADGLRLMNFFDIQPSILPGERCCGHDLLWSGDRENFLKLAKLNVEAIRDRGIEEVITACPECYHALARDYEANGVPLGCRVTHLYDFLDREIGKGAVAFKKTESRITFQDPCRLSRLEQRPDLPRKLLQRLNNAGFTEMKEHGAGALCCGNSAWIGCDAYSKALQVKRLRQAHDTGSDLLVTACPKCQIHLRCAMEDPFRGEELAIPMKDLATVLAETIEWK
jgi:Fe-S oxidoreductase/coenzyme F420-reducing hydrogenase delta subunit